MFLHPNEEHCNKEQTAQQGGGITIPGTVKNPVDMAFVDMVYW